MSRETIEWLNENTLIGFTEKRGNAWHHRQGTDNHYVGGIPMEDVRKRLFNWEAQEQPILVGHRVAESHPDAVGHRLSEQGIVLPDGVVPGYKAWVHPKTGEVLGVHKKTRALHDYAPWLLDTLGDVLDDGELEIATAGLLRGGRVAWVQVEVPENVETPEGVTFRPFVLIRSSMDASIPTSASRSITNAVCDNTMAIAAGEHGGQRIVFRASGNSEVKLAEARDALGIVYTAADDFAAQVAALTSIDFAATDFRKLLEIEIPGEAPEITSAGDFNRKLTHWKKVQEKREFVHDLYRFDERVAPWTGTAFGAWQAFNTFDQHERNVRGNRVERNQLQVLRGAQDRADAQIIGKILELAS